MKANSKIVLALLSIAFLLFNPAGICAGTPTVKSPAHPCCPSTPAPAPDASTARSCVCIDRPTPPPSVSPDRGGQEQTIVASPTPIPLLAVQVPGWGERAAARAVLPSNDRVLDFHQLLL